MTVAELIEELSKMDPDRKVVVFTEYGAVRPNLAPIWHSGEEYVWIR